MTSASGGGARPVPNIVVLGATGFVGRALMAALADRAVETARDLASRDPATPLGPGDVVVNCAGYVGDDEARLQTVNVALAVDTARRAAAAGARLVHVSSTSVFDGIGRGRLCETSSPKPSTSYGRSKLRGERAVRSAMPRACVVRPSKVIGGHDPRARLHALVRHVRDGRSLPVPSEGVWANFVPAADLGGLLRDLALAEVAAPAVVHATATMPWPRFIELLEQALGQSVARSPPPVVAASALAARALALVPAQHRPRRADRLLELWDRQHIVDSQGRFGAAEISAALADIVRRAS